MSGTVVNPDDDASATINLDDLIITVHKPKAEKTNTEEANTDKTEAEDLYTDFALNEFISNQGRLSRERTARDYNYQAIRQRLLQDLKISEDAALHPVGGSDTIITDEESFVKYITQVQRAVPNKSLQDLDAPDPLIVQQPTGERSILDGMATDGYPDEGEWKQAYDIPAFMIGDAPGLGKTGTALTVAVLFAQLMRMAREVRDERSNKGALQTRKHLPVTQPGRNNRCSSQGEKILCPCVAGGLSYSIVRAMSDFPTLVCCPPSLVGNWHNEAQLWIDKSAGSPSEGIHVWVRHDHFARDASYLGAQAIRNTQGVITGPFSNYTLTAQPGSSSNIIIFSDRGGESLIQAYDDVEQFPTQNPNPRKRNRSEKVNKLGCGFIFFDEYHRYKGKGNNPTGPFRLIRSIKRRLRTPLMAVGLSANLTLGPEIFDPFVTHAFETPPSGQESREIAGLTCRQDLAIHILEWEWLAANTSAANRPDNQNTGNARRDREEARRLKRLRDGVAEREARVIPFCHNFNPLMVAARMTETLFRGRPCGRASTAIRTVVKNMLDGPVLEAVQTLATAVRAYLNQEYHDLVKELTEKNREEEIPDRKTFMNDRITRIEQTPEQMAPWRALARAITFPYVAVLFNDKIIDPKSANVDELNAIGTPISQLLHPTRLADAQYYRIDTCLAQSPFHRHREQLGRESPKCD
ncbi:hypothetical protein F4678DRAFT_481201 [Xylaria arbuscula]|nr:hypothetical protein F4678DRAFT_481201 [Xylaria arbuscula]